MSQRVQRYSRTNAELRAMISRLLNSQQLRVLAAAPDLESVLRALRDTPYGGWLGQSAESAAALMPVERALQENLVSGFRRTASMLGVEQGAIILAMARGMELDNLKAILRAKVRGAPPAETRPLLVPLGPLSRLPIDDLLAAPDLEAVDVLLAGTEYGRVFRNALPRYFQDGSLFPVEIALDLDHYRRLWLCLEKLHGRDRVVLERMMGDRYDVLNVDWILRYRLSYHLSPEEIYNYTLPYGRRVNGDTVRRSAAALGIDGVAAALPEPYRSLLNRSSPAPLPIERAEIELQRYLVGVARLALTGDPFHLGVAVAYLWLKEAEVHDLRAILEGKRYGAAAEQILALLWSTT